MEVSARCRLQLSLLGLLGGEGINLLLQPLAADVIVEEYARTGIRLALDRA